MDPRNEKFLPKIDEPVNLDRDSALRKVDSLKTQLRTERAEKERKQKETEEREARDREIAEREELNCHMEQCVPDEAFMMEFYKGRHRAMTASDGIGSGAAFTFSVPGHRAIVGLKQNGIRWYYMMPGGTWVAGTLATALDNSELSPKEKLATHPLVGIEKAT